MCHFGKPDEEEITYPYDFLSIPLREKSKWNRRRGSYTKDFILYVDKEYQRLQQKKNELENQLVDVEWELERIEMGYWWSV